MPQKIYIITGGEYSDYGIEAVFTDEEKAKEQLHKEGRGVRIEIWWANLVEKDTVATYIHMSKEGDVLGTGKAYLSPEDKNKYTFPRGKNAEIWATIRAFKDLGIERFCCKRMIVSHVDLIDELLKFPRLQ